jgi:hypothetical protein
MICRQTFERYITGVDWERKREERVWVSPNACGDHRSRIFMRKRQTATYAMTRLNGQKRELCAVVREEKWRERDRTAIHEYSWWILSNEASVFSLLCNTLVVEGWPKRQSGVNLFLFSRENDREVSHFSISLRISPVHLSISSSISRTLFISDIEPWRLLQQAILTYGMNEWLIKSP